MNQATDKAYVERLMTVAPIILTGLHIAAVAVDWSSTWDDSGITLAFAKNLVELGDLKPCSGVERVEGYSSFLWMLINAAGYFMHNSAGLLLQGAKLLGLLCNVLNALLLWKILQTSLVHHRHRVLGLFLFLAASITVIESRNGMETPLFLLLFSSAYLLYGRIAGSLRCRLLFYAVTSLMMLVRHEAPLYLLYFFICEAGVLRGRVFRQPHYYVWLGVFGLYHGWHYLYFGSLLTNPMLAKQHPPYSPLIDSARVWLAYHHYPARFLVNSLLPLVVAAGVLLYRYGSGGLSLCVRFLRSHWQAVVFMGGVVLFNCAIGPAWGPTNRMAYIILPSLILFFLKMIETLAGGRRLPLWALLLLAVSFLPYQLKLYQRDYAENMPPLDLVAQNVRVMDAVRTRFGLRSMTYAGPDMGGVLLFGAHARIIDIGMLCNRTLAREGYGRFADFLFRQEKPDLMEIHGLWTAVTGISEMRPLYDDYIPLHPGGMPAPESSFAIMRYYVRRSLVTDAAIVRGDSSVHEFPEGNALDERIRQRFGNRYVQLYYGKE